MKNIHRMKLKSTNVKINTSDKILIILVIILLATYLMLKIFTIKSESVLLNYAENKSKELALLLITNVIEEITKEEMVDINTIMNIEKNNSDEIIGIDFNNKSINTLLLKINEKFHYNLQILENDKNNSLEKKYYKKVNPMIYEIPMSIVYDIPVLVGIGPKIPFKLDILGNTTNAIVTNIKDYGINNSLIEVVLETKINIQIILPFSSKEILTYNKIPLKSKIIQGKIPEYYGGVINGKIYQEASQQHRNLKHFKYYLKQYKKSTINDIIYVRKGEKYDNRSRKQ